MSDEPFTPHQLDADPTVGIGGLGELVILAKTSEDPVGNSDDLVALGDDTDAGALDDRDMARWLNDDASWGILEQDPQTHSQACLILDNFVAAHGLRDAMVQARMRRGFTAPYGNEAQDYIPGFKSRLVDLLGVCSAFQRHSLRRQLDALLDAPTTLLKRAVNCAAALGSEVYGVRVLDTREAILLTRMPAKAMSWATHVYHRDSGLVMGNYYSKEAEAWRSFQERR